MNVRIRVGTGFVLLKKVESQTRLKYVCDQSKTIEAVSFEHRILDGFNREDEQYTNG